MSSRNAQWKELTLRQVLSLEYGKGLPQRKRISGPYPVVGSGGVTGYHCQPLISGPGIIVGRKGSIGTVYFEKRDFWPIDTVYYVELDTTEHDLRFVYYMLLQLDLNRLNTDAAVPGLNRNVAYGQRCNIPPLPTQRKIAAILSTYDDLIENNTRRIAILEEMAQAIYREWFVHFCFPGHEEVAMVDSELGPIPEGWEMKRLEDVCNLVVGQSPKSEFYNEEGEGLPFHQGVKDFGDLFPTTRVYCTITKRVAEAGDILFSVRAPVGRINVADKKMVIGRGLHAIRSKTGNQPFILLQLKDKFREEDMMGGGTIFKAVTKSDMFGIRLLMPPTDLIARFEQIVVPMFSALKVLTEKNVNLRRTRDLLLPRLISGEVDVSELPIDTGAGHNLMDLVQLE